MPALSAHRRNYCKARDGWTYSTDSVVLTEWDDIGGVIGAVFVGIVAIFVLVVYLEKRLAPPAPASDATDADAENSGHRP